MPKTSGEVRAMRYPIKEVLLSTALLISLGPSGHAQAPAAPPPPAAPPAKTVQNFVPVTDQMMRSPKPEDWLMYRGNYQACVTIRSSNLTNAKSIRCKWAGRGRRGPA